MVDTIDIKGKVTKKNDTGFTLIDPAVWFNKSKFSQDAEKIINALQVGDEVEGKATINEKNGKVYRNVTELKVIKESPRTGSTKSPTERNSIEKQQAFKFAAEIVTEAMRHPEMEAKKWVFADYRAVYLQLGKDIYAAMKEMDEAKEKKPEQIEHEQIEY